MIFNPIFLLSTDFSSLWFIIAESEIIASKLKSVYVLVEDVSKGYKCF